jgi:glycosyltransferase involved in cell wall biosynthesis
MSKRILMLLSNEYRPDPRVEKEARTLVMAGFEVTVICWDREHRYPAERMESGVRIVRVRTGLVGSKPEMARRYPSFLLAVLREAKRREWDVVHAHDLDTLPCGLMVARLKGRPLVYDAHEHYSRMVEDDVPGIVVPILDRVEGSLVKRTDRIIAANDMIAEYLQPHAKSKISVVMNCIDPPSVTQRPPSSEESTIFYGGALEPQRYVLEVARAIAGKPGVRMRIAGTGSLQAEVEEIVSTSKNIEYLGYLDQKRMREEITSADLMVALLDPSNENNRIGTPNRLFEAMALGTPVLASEGTLSGRIVRSEESGYTLEWNESGLMEIMLKLKAPGERERLGGNGIRAVKERYNWEEMSRRLIQLYREV